MTETSKHNDALVADYLAAVGRTAGGLPQSRREELLADLSEHIAVMRAEAGADNEAAVRTILDRLGDPLAIVAEASRGDVSIRDGLDAPPVRAGRGRIVGILIAAVAGVLLLLCGGVIMFWLPSDVTQEPPRPVPAPSAAVTTP